MRTIIYAAVVAAAVAGIVPAVAGEGEGAVENTQFTQFPGVIAQSPVPSVPSVAMVRTGQEAAAFVTQSSPAIWVSPPYDVGGDNR